jgi:23S rRNA U2552 (ribose-2'-O)-methylase RlmE/FtsJ
MITKESYKQAKTVKALIALARQENRERAQAGGRLAEIDNEINALRKEQTALVNIDCTPPLWYEYIDAIIKSE